MLSKEAISTAKNMERHFLSSLVGKKGGEPSSELNKEIPTSHFKMESLFLLEEILLPVYLRDAYFPVPQFQNSQKYVRF